MHFGTYPVLAGTPEEFRTALAKRKLAGKLIVMKPGEDRSFYSPVRNIGYGWSLKE